MNGIAFNESSIGRIRADAKTQTRRPMKKNAPVFRDHMWEINSPTHFQLPDGEACSVLRTNDTTYLKAVLGQFAQYLVGEVRFVREAWATLDLYDHLRPSELHHLPGVVEIWYMADGPKPEGYGRTRQGMFLPARFAREFVRITAIKAERLMEITVDDAVAEGIPIPYSECPHGPPLCATYTGCYIKLWDSIYHSTPFESEHNPWLFAYTFERCTREGVRL